MALHQDQGIHETAQPHGDVKPLFKDSSRLVETMRQKEEVGNMDGKVAWKELAG